MNCNRTFLNRFFCWILIINATLKHGKVSNEHWDTNYFKNYAINKIINNIKDDLKKIDIYFDIFTFESDIVKKDYIEGAFEDIEDDNDRKI